MSTARDQPAPIGLRLAAQPVERADAARNRNKILDAAARLADENGVDALAMDDVARAAGVGVGTVYRRFGDRAGLVVALLDHHETDFQSEFFYGPPPLGPGAPSRDRIEAFLRAMVRWIETHGPYMLVAESQGPFHRYSRAYALHHMHLTALLADAAPPGTDAPHAADALLAAVSAALVTFQLRERGMDTERIEAGVIALLDGLLRAP